MERLEQKLRGFWALIQDTWTTGALGIDFGRLLTALLIVALFLILCGLFTRFVMGTLRRVAARTDTKMDDAFLHALDGPVRFIPLILSLFIAIEYLALTDRYADIGGQIIRTLVVFDLFWALYQIIGPVSWTFTWLEELLTKEMVDWLIKLLHFVIIFIGAATILEIWGIKIGPVLAGLGLFGVAVALGAQDLFKNLIAGILVIAEKRMRVGDWILIDGLVEGTVETLGFRSTLVHRFDKAPVHVPNAKLSDSAVTNFSAMTHRRIKWMIGIDCRATVEQLRTIRDEIEAYILDNPDFAPPSDVATFVRIDRFSDSSIDILLYCFTRTTDWGGWLKIKEALAYRVKDIVEAAGTGFAFPSRSLYVESIPGDAPEVFIPPQS